MAGVKGRSGTKYAPTDTHRRQVKMMLGCGLPQQQIALVLGLNRRTLAKHFKSELALGAAEHNALVAEALFRAATVDKNIAAMIFWCKTRMGWRETNVVENRHQFNGDARERLIGILTAPPAGAEDQADNQTTH